MDSTPRHPEWPFHVAEIVLWLLGYALIAWFDVRLAMGLMCWRGSDSARRFLNKAHEERLDRIRRGLE